MAQSAPQEEERRTALYREGVDAAKSGRWAEARDRFAAALTIRPSAKVFFSLAQAEEQVGQLARALRHYRSSLEGAQTAGESEVVSAAKSALSTLEPRVPGVRIVVSGAADATAMIDGAQAPIGEPVPVDPGDHRVVVTAPGMATQEATLAIGERQQLDVPVRLVSAAPPAAPLPPSADSSGRPWSWWRTAAVVAGGAGVVALGLGTYFGVEAKNKNDESNTSGCSGSRCTQAGASIRRDALSAASASTAAFIAGVGLVAGGVVLWLLAPSSKDGGGVGLSPMTMWTGGGLSVSGSWR